ncbi:YggS family pyridoxal phosphate-dependent enzyme [Pontiella agarivorans]|uniref:Pyridoxal phosphate homeostasis protein n=1 Tax=Pontiella agarivorans TaxID=3038953 RepID=A0ABU5MW88_9BACT|nr:YggS family pyridoxal phosphate-dependent enzyme [Pontiella agarivorans]MDZ8118478.1 YggS family pyridoxal phosphate-dependent enzyme [Pontiella agarivorans]
MEETFSDRLERVEHRIQAACEKAGRARDSVTLLAVSKTKPPEAVRAAVDCGLRLFGENKVQEAQSKIPMSPGGLEWHLIGHLQSNKAKVAANLFQMIHSVDSLKLLQTLESHANQTLPVLLQVNIAGEAAKYGFKPEEVAGAIEAANQMSKCEVHGLMLIPPFAPDPEKTRVHFSSLRKLRDQLQDETGTPLPELSMGMSHDLEVAIEEGSTWIRIGTDLFGKRG